MSILYHECCIRCKNALNTKFNACISLYVAGASRGSLLYLFFLSFLTSSHISCIARARHRASRSEAKINSLYNGKRWIAKRDADTRDHVLSRCLTSWNVVFAMYKVFIYIYNQSSLSVRVRAARLDQRLWQLFLATNTSSKYNSYRDTESVQTYFARREHYNIARAAVTDMEPYMCTIN